MRSVLALAALLSLPAAVSVMADDAAVPAHLAAAVADSDRPDSDKQRDTHRKPGESMAFAGVASKNVVIELIPGGGYYTRLLSKAIGSKGRVYAVVPAPRPDAAAGSPDRSAPIKALAADKAYHNVTVLVQPIKSLQLPAGADLVWTSDNYHDVHNVPDIDMLAFNKAVWAALKPGGVYLVIDHAAAPDAPADVTSTLHRIRVATVTEEVEAAGFKLEAESSALRNPEDSHELKVFEPAIQGKTDQFMLKFRKPRA